MTHLCSVDYNEAYLLVLQNGCLGIGLGDCDLNHGWLEVVGLIAPNFRLNEHLEFSHNNGNDKHYHCKSIRPDGRFMGHYHWEEMIRYPDVVHVWAPVEFDSAPYGIRATNFEAQLQWLADHNVRCWSFYPAQGLDHGRIKLVWMFADVDDAMLFKLAWT